MSEHKHTTLIEGCYRCDLNLDELRGDFAPPAEPKCAECGDADHVGRECGTTKFAGNEIGVCRCYRPFTPAEPDATERARAFAEACGYKWVGEMPYDRLPELFTSQLLAFLESETPRIKADAVWEFVAEVEKEANRLMDASKSRYGLQSQIGDHYPSAIQQVQARQIKAEIEEVK